ncbi:hypothetical protein [Sphingomonas sp.]|uniref:hypothetical protein n=1 Tax=Sphingomonas sp. TaxID=28214 RepID=UPI001ED1D048|nr:hypothetical protein [Sphingomonas sp.]MBX3595750.1 hypothetical protein [Sphingomonas sp.]
MMRESGLVGLLQVIFACVREGYGRARAWQVMAGFAGLVLLIVAAFAVLISAGRWLA